MKLFFLLLLCCAIDATAQDNTALLREFAAAKNDSVFIAQHSAAAYTTTTLELQFPHQPLTDARSRQLFDAAPGTVLGPFNDQHVSHYYKITGADSSGIIHLKYIFFYSGMHDSLWRDSIARLIVNAAQHGADLDSLCLVYDPSGRDGKAPCRLMNVFSDACAPEFSAFWMARHKGEIARTTSNSCQFIGMLLEEPQYERRRVRFVTLDLPRP